MNTPDRNDETLIRINRMVRIRADKFYKYLEENYGV